MKPLKQWKCKLHGLQSEICKGDLGCKCTKASLSKMVHEIKWNIFSRPCCDIRFYAPKSTFRFENEKFCPDKIMSNFLPKINDGRKIA